MFARSLLITTALFTTFACGSDEGDGENTGGSAGDSGASGAGTGGDAEGGDANGGQSNGGAGGTVGGNGGATAGDGGESNGGTGGDGGAGGSSGGGGEGGTGGTGPMKQFTCPPGPFDPPMVIGEPQTLCQGFQFNQDFNEGPTWIKSQGAFFFSNFVQGAQGGNLNGDIIKYTPGGSCELFITGTGTNGLAVGADGNIVGACHKTRSVTRYDVETKAQEILVDSYMGNMLDSPNDLVVHSKGSIYFTNPIYELGGRPQGVGPAVFWLNPEGELTMLAQVGAQPNGIALSPDETKLYIVNGGVWDIDPDGVPSNRQEDFPNADGIAVDCAGNIYLSNGTILDSTFQQVGTFPGGTNLAFGGEDGTTLFVVGGGTQVHAYQMNIPGLP